MNSVDLIGRLTRDPELKTTQNGKNNVSFNLAVDGFKKDDVSFIRCQAWNNVAKVIANYTHKGSRVSVSGRLDQHSFDDRNGNRVSITEVIVNNMDLLDPKNQDNNGQQSGSYQNNRENNGYQDTKPAYQPGSKSKPKEDVTTINDDDLPF